MVVCKVKASKYERLYSILVKNKRKVEIRNLAKLGVSKPKYSTNVGRKREKD